MPLPCRGPILHKKHLHGIGADFGAPTDVVRRPKGIGFGFIGTTFVGDVSRHAGYERHDETGHEWWASRIRRDVRFPRHAATTQGRWRDLLVHCRRPNHRPQDRQIDRSAGSTVQQMRRVGYVRQKRLDIPEATPIVQEKISTGVAGLF